MTLDDVHAFRESGHGRRREGAAFHGVVVDADDGRLLGSCGLVDVDWVDLVGEVGYWTAAAARRQRRGDTGRPCRLPVRVRRARAGAVGPRGVRGQPRLHAVARALGFTLEGTLRSVATVEGGTDRPQRFDMNVWGLLPGELT